MTYHVIRRAADRDIDTGYVMNAEKGGAAPRCKWLHSHTQRAHNKDSQLGYIDRNRRTARVGVFHISIAFQVNVQKLEHQIQLLVGMHNVH